MKNPILPIICLSIGICAQTSDAAHTQASHAANSQCQQFKIDAKGHSPLHQVTIPPSSKCSLHNSNGFLLPDPDCTPGATNPSITQEVLRNPEFTTRCVRDQATTAQEKSTTYKWYGLKKSANNTGQTQVCELDHLVSLELGGADTLDNIWPQCGPSGVALQKRFFKRKDTVENYLAKQVRDGNMSLDDAQRGIAKDWTQYLKDAEVACPNGKCP